MSDNLRIWIREKKGSKKILKILFFAVQSVDDKVEDMVYCNGMRRSMTQNIEATEILSFYTFFNKK